VLDNLGNLMSAVCVNIPLENLSAFLAEQQVTPNSRMFIANAKDELIAHYDAQSTTTRDKITGELRMAQVNEAGEPWLVDAFRAYRQRHADGRTEPQTLLGLWQRLSTAWERLVTLGEVPSPLEVFVYPFYQFSLSRTDGRTYITYVVPFPKSFASSWEIFVVLPEEDLLQAVDSMRYQAALTALAILLIALLVGIWLANLLTRPIIRLAAETDKIRHLHLDEVESIDSNIQEIDVMSTALLTTTHGLQAFRKYVPASLVRQLIELGQEAELGGEEVELTTFFSDVAGFTTVSENMPAQALMHHLSEYLEELSQIILEKHGTIDKYMGDSIMAFWGAPVQQMDAPILACHTALLCQRKVMELNTAWARAGKPLLHTRIGMHTGVAVVGNVGSNERMNYTAVGDSINLASRLEGINKLYGTRIIISEATYERVAEHFFCRLLDVVAVKGKTHGQKIYELIDEKTAVLPLALQQFYRDYALGMEAYLQQDWQQAQDIFCDLQQQHTDDPALALFIKRCITFQQQPSAVPEHWDGTVALLEK
ncbi:MAG: HAMP domain-containing protein, partial [Candidatus Tectomicrobia bacterium]|nr:HAMP domain-containing protein [Candidatus Tectomicrobia bacterium]